MAIFFKILTFLMWDKIIAEMEREKIKTQNPFPRPILCWHLRRSNLFILYFVKTQLSFQIAGRESTQELQECVKMTRVDKGSSKTIGQRFSKQDSIVLWLLTIHFTTMKFRWVPLTQHSKNALILEEIRNGILLPKFFWPTVRKIIF